MTNGIDAIIIQQSSPGKFMLAFSRADVDQIHYADIDLLIKTKDGRHYILPGAALAAMEETPPQIMFKDMVVAANVLLAGVHIVEDQVINTHIMGTSDRPEQKSAEEVKALEKELADVKEKLDQQKELIHKVEEQAKALNDASEQIEAQDQQINETAALQSQIDAAEELQKQFDKIVEQLHTKDYDYVAPREFQPPPAPFSGPAGVPAPISMTPLVLLTMGNVVDSEVVGSTYYGGAGADGSSASAKLGPRDSLQFSAATITGSSGNDIIYADGSSLLGNTDPSIDTSHYAKQFLLRVAGYFTELNDIVLKGLPDYVSVTGATKQADGSWVLPSSYVIAQNSFELVYDKDAWRTSGSDSFDMIIEVSGQMRNTAFASTETFRFLFMDVTDAAQVTDQYLTYWDDGQSKQVYVLPTQDQPNLITAGAGDDLIYGGRSHDTVDAGSGNDTVYAYGGNNTITGGAGNDYISTGSGDDLISGGDDNDTIEAGAGNNTIDTGGGTNSVTAGSGDDSITGGAGADTINAGEGNNAVNAGEGVNAITTGSGDDTLSSGASSDIILAGDGNNTIHAGAGNNQITSGIGNDSIVVGDGNNIILAGDGNNTVTTGNGDNTITSGAGRDVIVLGAGTNVVVSGAGNDFLYGGDGNDTFDGGDGDDWIRAGLGTNILNGGAGVNTADYGGLGSSITASLGSNSASGTGVSDTLSGISNIVGTAYADTIVGNASANVLTGAAGDDVIVGGGGTDTMYGGDGNDTITGNTGNDTIFGDAGNDTISGGGGTDALYGGDGDDTFINPNVGIAYDGGAGTDKIDYSAQTNALTIDLAVGTGYIGTTQIASYTSIEWIVGGTGADTLTGSAGNDTLEGGAGNDTLTGGTGTNTLIGGTGSNYYNMGLGSDYVVANGTANWDEVRYYNSGAAVVVNLDTVVHSFVNTLGATITVAALSGTSRGEIAADASSYALGDTYAYGGVDYLYTGNYNDILWGSDVREYFYAGAGNDIVYAGGGNDFVYMSAGNDLSDGGVGADVFYSGWSSANMTIYLDGTADVNGNAIADYIDKSASGFLGSGFTGFANGWSGTTLLMNLENVIGGGGSDLIVGDANANEINPVTGNNIVYGLGGNDIIYGQLGSNAIDGGTGTDTISFSNVDTTLTGTTTGGSSYSSAISAEIYLLDTDLDGNGAMDRAATWGSYAGFTARTLSSGVYTYSTVTNVENIVGTVNADKLAGDANANMIRGYNGDDYISGNGGADSLYGDAGNDTFVMASSHISGATLISGGAGTDTLKSSGWTFTSGTIYASGSKFANIETVDARNSTAGGVYSINAYDIQSMVDSGSSSSLQLYLDSGDTLSCVVGAGTGAVSYTNPTHTSANDVFRFYSDASKTVLVATLNVHYGA